MVGSQGGNLGGRREACGRVNWDVGGWIAWERTTVGVIWGEEDRVRKEWVGKRGREWVGEIG